MGKMPEAQNFLIPPRMYMYSNLNKILFTLYYLERYQSYRADIISLLKITKGNNFAKYVGGVTIINLCKSSSHALYLCQVL